MAEVTRLKEQGRLFFQKGEWEKARRASEQVLMFDSEDTEFSLILGDVYLQCDDSRKALDQFEKTLRLAEKSGDYGRGIVACRRILAIDRERIELYNKTGELYFRMGLKSGTVREWLKYADQLKLRSDFTAISVCYQKIAGILPENPGLRELAVRVKLLTDQLLSDTSESAPEPADIAPYRRLVDVALKMGQPRKIMETQLSYARVLQRRGFARKAKAVYQKILERDPTNEEALSKVLALQDSSEVDQAKLREDFFAAGRAFQEAAWAKIDEAYEPYYELGVLFRSEGLRDEAIIEFQQAIKGGGRQLKAFEMLAVSFLEQGDFGLAKEVLHQGLSIKKFLDNEYVGLHYNLGLAHEQMGDLAKALGEYEQVYILDITYKDVAARLRRIEAQLKVQAQPAAEAKPASTAPSETEPRPEPDTTPVAVIEAAPEAPLQVEPAPSAADMPPETDLPPQPAEAAEVLEPAPVMMPESPAPAVEFPGGQPSPNEEAREEIYLKDQGLSFL
jgi:tetratricopeptide (TPR) repeat protein